MLIDHKREQINSYEELIRLHRKGIKKHFNIVQGLERSE